MGIYKYTLRSATKTLGNVEIGQFKYGWKPFWGDERSRVIQSLRAAADRAVEKLEGVELFVQGDWYDGQPVHWTGRPFAELTEEFGSSPHIGWVIKDSRGRWALNIKTDDELLREYPEIGYLQTAEGRKYYISDGIDSRSSLNLYQVITNVRLLRARNWR